MSISYDNSESSAKLPVIQGVDTAKGIAMTGGTAGGYLQVLSMFRRDAEDRLQKLRYYLYESMTSGDDKFPEKHISAFITQVHALKSASATIGAAEISAEADRFETAARAGELVTIRDNLPDFVEHLAELAQNIRAAATHIAEGKEAKSSSSKKGKTDISVYFPEFNKLIEALKSKNVSDVDAIMENLINAPMDLAAEEILEQISDQILMTEFESAITSIENLMNSK